MVDERTGRSMEKPEHISEQYDQELDSIRSQVLAMGGIVEDQIRDAALALLDSNTLLADGVVEADIQVNTMEVQIDHACTQLIARRQPTARDLRLVVSILKTITDLERIGDEAEKIAKLSYELARLEPPATRFIEIKHLSGHVRSMLHNALNAFARMDAQSALKIIAEDKEVDREYDAVMRQLMTIMMEDPRSIRRVLNTMWSARALERIGDHAKNICEYIVYSVHGTDIRHIGFEQKQRYARALEGQMAEAPDAETSTDQPPEET